MSEKILFQSRGFPEFRFLSNFHVAPFTVGPAIYPTVEHYYQAAKCAGRDQEFASVMASKTPGEARRRGQSVTLPEGWEILKLGVMRRAVQLKFEQNLDLKEALLATDGFELVEYAPWGDTFWGVGKDYVGQNNLGKILMEVRAELKEKS